MRLRVVDHRDSTVAADDPFRVLVERVDLVGGLGRSEWSANVVLVDDGAMAGLNEGYRHAEGVTDVLSFSYLVEAGQGEPDLAAGVAGARRDLWLDPLEGGCAAEADGRSEPVEELVGELVLAPGFVATRCREKGWPLEHEVPLLLVHGCLHVLGWLHGEEEDRRLMRQEEARLLGAVGLPHPLNDDGPAGEPREGIPESGTR